VLINSATHFRSWFEGRAKAIVTANTPGITAENFALFRYRKLQRPVYPLDPDMEWDAFDQDNRKEGQ
jgi:microcystin degradation protein MlrC